MSVLVWAQIFTWFREQEGELSYIDLAQALYQPPITVAHMAQISAAMQPLLGSWILRGRDRQSQVYRLEFSEPQGERAKDFSDESSSPSSV